MAEETYNVYFGAKLIWADGKAMVNDRLGSAIARVTDVGGINVERHDYFPYGGEMTATANNRNKFGTYLRDAATGLDYADQRYLETGYGRFLTSDLSYTAPRSQRPTSWNKTSYVEGDPLNHNDPGGTLQAGICFDEVFCITSREVGSPSLGAELEFLALFIAVPGGGYAPGPTCISTPVTDFSPVPTLLCGLAAQAYAVANAPKQYEGGVCNISAAAVPIDFLPTTENHTATILSFKKSEEAYETSNIVIEGGPQVAAVVLPGGDSYLTLVLNVSFSSDGRYTDMTKVKPFYSSDWSAVNCYKAGEIEVLANRIQGQNYYYLIGTSNSNSFACTLLRRATRLAGMEAWH